MFYNIFLQTKTLMKIISGFVGDSITIKSIFEDLGDDNEFILSTPGGDLWEGWAIHDLLKGKIDMIEAVGLVASSGVQILLSAKNRIGHENSRYLIHNPWNFAAGDINAHQKNVDDLKKETDILINKYVEISGKDIEYISNLMKEERVLFPSEALELNIITQIKKTDMTEKKDETKEKLNLIETALNKIMNLVNPRPKNIVVTDVNGVELDFGENEIQVGATATANGEAANGEYVIADGRTLIFENGTLTEIREATAETEALKTENATLKSEIENLKNQLTAKNTEIENFKKETATQIQNITKEFTEFKAKFSKKENVPDNTPIDKQTEEKKLFSFKKKETNK